MDGMGPLRPLYYSSIFISDVHLGFKGCQADLFLDFLRSSRCEYLFLVGDWVESCSALVEYRDGRLELIDWAEMSGGEGAHSAAVRHLESAA